MAPWVISVCATQIKGKKTLSSQWGPASKHSNFLHSVPPALTPALPTESHLPSSPFATKTGGFGDFGLECDPAPPAEAAHSSGSRRLLETTTPCTGLQSDLICSDHMLKTIAWCHRCFLVVGTSVTPGNVCGRGVESIHTQKLVDLTLEILVCTFMNSGIF